MLTLLTGKTGSGKSFQAVKTVFDVVQENKVFTNIEISLDSPNYIYMDELEVRKFLFYIESTFKDVTNLEEKKNEVKNSIYFGGNFFIDEAHLVGFRDKKESILNWLTLHRHFNQNVHIITQIASNIHRDYLALFHEHIDMLPPNKRLSKGMMGFRHYDSYKGERLKTQYFKPNLDIFELYNSGNVELGFNKNVVQLALVLLGIIGIGLMFYFLSSTFYDNVTSSRIDTNLTTVPKSINPPGQNVTQIDNNISENNDTSFYDVVFCDTKDGCYFEGAKYTLFKFKSIILRRYSHTRQIVLQGKDYQMIKYTLAKH